MMDENGFQTKVHDSNDIDLKSEILLNHEGYGYLTNEVVQELIDSRVEDSLESSRGRHKKSTMNFTLLFCAGMVVILFFCFLFGPQNHYLFAACSFGWGVCAYFLERNGKLKFTAKDAADIPKNYSSAFLFRSSFVRVFYRGYSGYAVSYYDENNNIRSNYIPLALHKKLGGKGFSSKQISEVAYVLKYPRRDGRFAYRAFSPDFFLNESSIKFSGKEAVRSRSRL